MKIFLSIFFLLLSSSLFSQTTNDTCIQSTEKKTIAVIPFRSFNSSFTGARIQKDIADILFSSQTLCVVVPSDYANDPLGEMTEANVIEFGKAGGFDFVVFGTLSSFRSRSEKERGDPDDPDDVDVVVTITRVSVELHIMDVNQGELLFSNTISGEHRESEPEPDNLSDPLLDFAIDLAIALVEILIDDDDDRAFKNRAFKNLVSRIKYRMADLFKLTATITEVKDNGDIIVPFGTGEDVRKGQRFRVYIKDDDSIFRVGNARQNNYKHIGTIRVRSIEDSFSIARAVRPFDMDNRTIIEKMNFVGFTFGLYSTFGSYKISGYENTRNSHKGDGKLTISVPKLDYSYSVHLGMGATIPIMPVIFTPTISFGVLFGDLFKTSWGLDTRINLEFQIPVYHEIINISITPYMSFAFTYSEIGNVSGGDYYEDIHIKNGATIMSNDFFFGGGILGTVRFNFNDTVGLSIGAGYKFYTDRINMSTYAFYDDGLYSDDENNVADVTLKNTPNYLIDLSGFEVVLSINFMF